MKNVMKAKNIINFPSLQIPNATICKIANLFALRKIARIFAPLGIALIFITPLCAKEPPAVIIGAGVGEGQTLIEFEHPLIAKIPLVKEDNTPYWTALTDPAPLKSWALSWEFVLGYKHFINDFLGLRYYANIGIQHYKPSDSKQIPIAIIDYTANADLLIDFYDSDSVAFGIFGGVGFGGTSFDKKAINQYMDIYNDANIYNGSSSVPIGASDIKRHFMNVNFSAGVRLVIFQKVSMSGGAKHCDRYDKGKRVCVSATSFIGHGFEAVAKFPVMTYTATTPDYLMSTDYQNFRSRPEYRIKNPYRFTFRYVVEF